MNLESIGTIVALVLTIMVYTYLIGDIPVFRVIFQLAEHILVGVSVGWATVQVFNNLILPTVDRVRNSGDFTETLLVFAIPVILGVTLFTRSLRASRPLTNLIMALVVGTVGAVSLVGALAGTLLPQIGAAITPLNGGGAASDVIGRIVLLLGTLLALWYFQFTVFKSKSDQPNGLQTLNVLNSRVRLLGRWSIMLAFGAVFAAVFLTYFAALLDRLFFIIHFHI